MSSIPGDWQDEAYWRLRREAKEYIAQMAETIKSQKAKIERLRAYLKECSDELEAYIGHRYSGTLDYPSQKQKFDSEMSVVLEARKLLAATNEQATSIDPKIPTDIDPEYFDREPTD